MPEALPYLNLHAHQPAADGSQCIVSLSRDFQNPQQYPLVSIGLHPWYLQDAPEAFAQLETAARAPEVKAIGECGLDRLKGPTLAEQEHWFIQQIGLAERLRKPLIIHCVKAFDDLIRIRNAQKVTVPFIVHGYNTNPQIAAQLLKHGFYLSFGKALLQEGSNAATIIKTWPLDRLFLETDDADIAISRIFAAAAVLLEMEPDALNKQIHQNYNTLFNS